ncbi:MAG: hypothetical protein AVDCRST_MAG57-1609, partial [uncultured Blastococcus sp.]
GRADDAGAPATTFADNTVAGPAEDSAGDLPAASVSRASG